jgi:hypothetical protein
MLGAPFLLHETLGCPIANLHSARSDLWEPQFVLHPTQLRKKHCFVKSTSNDLTAVGITTCLPSELTSSLRIGEFPCRLLPTKNHHFAALRFPDFQRWHILPSILFNNAVGENMVMKKARHDPKIF